MGAGPHPYSPAGRAGAEAPGERAGSGGSQLCACPRRLLAPALAKEAPPHPHPPGLLSAIHPLELACRDRFRKPVGGWKQLVSRAGGRLRAAENECPEEDKAENKGKPAPFPIFLFGLIFQKQSLENPCFGPNVSSSIFPHLLQASIDGPSLSL